MCVFFFVEKYDLRISVFGIGIMKLDDLKHIFKSTNLNLADAQEYIVNLLNKFEVALTWDNRTLLIPSLLPSEEETQNIRTTSVRVRNCCCCLFLNKMISTIFVNVGL